MRAIFLVLLFLTGCAETASLLAKTSAALHEALNTVDAVHAKLDQINDLVCAPDHVLPETVNACADVQDGLSQAHALERAARAAAAELDSDAGVP